MRGKILAGCLATLCCLTVCVRIASAAAADDDGARALRVVGPSTVTIRGESVCAGIILDDAGTILTTAATCVSPIPITVDVDSGRPGAAGRVTFKNVRVFAIHPNLDLALLKVDPAEHPGVALAPAQLGVDKQIAAGDRVFAVRVGGAAKAMVPGTLSAVDRVIDGVTYHEFAAAVTPDECGGPLVNADGRIVGYVSFRPENEAAGVGFAIGLRGAGLHFVAPPNRKNNFERAKAAFEVGLRYDGLSEAAISAHGKDDPEARRYSRLKLECFRRTLVDEPAHATTCFNLGIAYSQRDGQPAIGVAYFLKAMDLRPWGATSHGDGREYHWLAQTFAQMNRKDLAEAAWREGLAKFPRTGVLWEDLAYHAYEEGPPADVLRGAAVVRRLWPDTRNARSLDAMVGIARGKMRPEEVERVQAELEPAAFERMLSERQAVADDAKWSRKTWMTESFAAIPRDFGPGAAVAAVRAGPGGVAPGPTTPAPKPPPTPAPPAGLVKLDKPQPVDVMKKGDVRLRGSLKAYDQDEAHLTVDGKEQRVRWVDLAPGSAFRLRSTLIDQKNPDQWLALGEFGWGLNLKAQAEQAFRSAVRLSPDAAARADAIRATAPGALLGGEAQASRGPAAGASAPSVPAPAAALPGPVGNDPELLKPKEQVRPTKYQPATPEEHGAAIAAARARAAEVDAKLGVRLAELQTDHFLIFTDWDPAEHGFLRENLEAAYAAVARQFDIPARENIFVGKLPVYMFARRETFQRFSMSIDDAGVPESALGYYRHRSDGVGHMTMWKPEARRAGGARSAEVLWAYTLTHEFAHAFVARYRSNVFIPPWLNEGIAEVVASAQFPALDRRRDALLVAERSPSIQWLFTTRAGPPAPMYPVMQTLVETLAAGAKDKATFVSFFNDIKDGVAVDESLKRHYKTDFPGLERAWRVHLDRTRNAGGR